MWKPLQSTIKRLPLTYWMAETSFIIFTTKRYAPLSMDHLNDLVVSGFNGLMDLY